MPTGKYHKQLRKVFISIGFLFSFILMLSVSYNIISSIKNQYLSTIKQTVSSYNTLSEVSLSAINSALNTMIQNPDIKLWGNATAQSHYYFDAAIAHKTINKLTSQFSMVPFYPAVTKLPEDIFVISSLGSSSKSLYFQTETSLSPEQSAYALNRLSDQSGQLVIPTYTDHLLNDIHFFIKKPYDLSNLLYIIRIPRSSLFSADPAQKFIMFNQEQILAYSHNDPDTKADLDHIYTELCTQTILPDAQPPINIKNNNVYVSKFSKSTWQIAYIYPNIDLTFRQIAVYILFPFAALAALLLLMFKGISNWLYSPIKNVMSEVMDSNYASANATVDEFQLLKQNASTAKNLAEKLQAVINENDSLISQKFYRDLILGVNVKENPIYKNLVLKPKSYCVALIEFTESDNEILEKDIFFCKSAIFSFTQSHEILQSVNLSHTTCAVIIQTDQLEDAKNAVLSITEILPEEQAVKIAISDIRFGIEHIYTCFEEGKKTLEYKYLYANSEILTARQVSEKESHAYFYPIVTENRLIQNVAEGRDFSLQIFDDLIRENFMRRDLTPDTLRNFIYTLLSTLNRTFQELKTTPKELLGHPVLFDQYYANWNQPNIISDIRKILTETADAVKLRNANADSRTLTEMHNYIYTNYSSDIMLHDMADELGISAKYCSNLFKKLSDENFKNFLNRYRVEKAKEIMEANPQIKITDLCTKVGFNSSNTLIRVFGKYTGMTPKTFLNMITEDK